MDKRQFGERLRRHRKNMTFQELADLTDISESHIRRLEAGEKNPTLQTLVKLSNALKTTPDALIYPQTIAESDYLKSHSFEYEKLTDRQILLVKSIIESIQNFGMEDHNNIGLVGKRIQAYRVSKKFSANDFATELGISTVFLGSIEAGKVPVSISRIEKICEILDVNVNDLLHDVSPQSAVIYVNKVLENNEIHTENVAEYEFLKSIFKYALLFLQSQNPQAT